MVHDVKISTEVNLPSHSFLNSLFFQVSQKYSINRSNDDDVGWWQQDLRYNNDDNKAATTIWTWVFSTRVGLQTIMTIHKLIERAHHVIIPFQFNSILYFRSNWKVSQSRGPYKIKEITLHTNTLYYTHK